MSFDELYQQMAQSVIEGEPELAEELTHKGLEQGAEPLEMIDKGYGAGLQVVGELFEKGEYFLPHLVIGAEAMKAAMTVLEPELRRRQQARRSQGKVVLGTVEGDIHEIGKTLVGTMLSASGFEVFDLGVDVKTEDFVAKVKDTGATLVGLSALLTTTMAHQELVIRALNEAGVRDQVKVIVGGAPVSAEWARQIGADGYSEDAVSAVALARQLLQ